MCVQLSGGCCMTYGNFLEKSWLVVVCFIFICSVQPLFVHLSILSLRKRILFVFFNFAAILRVGVCVHIFIYPVYLLQAHVWRPRAGKYGPERDGHRLQAGQAADVSLPLVRTSSYRPCGGTMPAETGSAPGCHWSVWLPPRMHPVPGCHWSAWLPSRTPRLGAIGVPGCRRLPRALGCRRL